MKQKPFCSSNKVLSEMTLTLTFDLANFSSAQGQSWPRLTYFFVLGPILILTVGNDSV